MMVLGWMVPFDDPGIGGGGGSDDGAGFGGNTMDVALGDAAARPGSWAGEDNMPITCRSSMTELRKKRSVRERGFIRCRIS